MTCVSVVSGNQHETVLKVSNKEFHKLRLQLANLEISLTIDPTHAVITVINGLGGTMSQVYSLSDEPDVHDRLRAFVKNKLQVEGAALQRRMEAATRPT